MDDTSTRMPHGHARHRSRGAQHQPVLVQIERDVAAELIRSRTRPWSSSAPIAPTASSPSPPQPSSIPISPPSRSGMPSLGFKGVGVGSSVPAKSWPTRSNLADKCEELRHPGLRHPLKHRDSGAAAGWAAAACANTIGNPLESPIGAVAPDLRGARSIAFPELKICAQRSRRRLPPVLRQPLGHGDPLLPQPRRPAAQENPTAYLGTASSSSTPSCSRLRRCAISSPSRSGSDHDRHGLPVPVDQHRDRPGAQHTRTQRRAAHRHPGRHRSEAARDRVVTRGPRASGPCALHTRLIVDERDARGPRMT